MEIVFSDKSLTNERKEQIKEIIESEVKNFNLKLDQLGTLILLGNREEEFKILESYIERDKVNSTLELLKSSLGMRITDKYNKSSVIISEPCWRGIASGKQDYQDFCIHVINHEFVHVHDHTIIFYDIYPESEERVVAADDLSFIFRLKAKEMWGEYVAERLSTPTVTDKYIYHTVETLERRLDSMLSLDKILVSFATLLGIQHGLGNNCKYDIEGYVKEIVKDKRLLQAWDYMNPVLQKLFFEYPHWNSINELDGLSGLLFGTWEKFKLV